MSSIIDQMTALAEQVKALQTDRDALREIASQEWNLLREIYARMNPHSKIEWTDEPPQSDVDFMRKLILRVMDGQQAAQRAAVEVTATATPAAEAAAAAAAQEKLEVQNVLDKAWNGEYADLLQRAAPISLQLVAAGVMDSFRRGRAAETLGVGAADNAIADDVCRKLAQAGLKTRVLYDGYSKIIHVSDLQQNELLQAMHAAERRRETK